jgi:hypothetical protein
MSLMRLIFRTAGNPLWILVFTVGLLPALTAPASAQEVELIMIREPGCVWCELWDKEIGPIYPKTTESVCAPVRMVANLRNIPDDVKPLRLVRYTPTFLLTRDGVELARVEGYPGADFFWPMLDRMLRKFTDFSDSREPCTLKTS